MPSPCTCHRAITALCRLAPRLQLLLLVPGTTSCVYDHWCVAEHAGADTSIELEQLCWLVAMCGHVLAVDGNGETPLVPLAIVHACEEAAAAAAASGRQGGGDPAERLSAGLLAVGGHCLAHSGRSGASPRCGGGR